MSHIEQDKSPEISDIIISRQCNLLFHEVSELSFYNLAEINQALNEIKTLKAYKRSLIVEKIFSLIPEETKSQQNRLLRIKRQIFNDKEINAKDRKCLASYPDLHEIFLEWIELSQQEKNRNTLAEKKFSAYLDEARKKVVALCERADFKQAIQLSGQRLLKQLEKYALSIKAGSSITKALRQSENKIINFLYRMALKPAPFASFTTIKMHLPKPLSEPTQQLKYYNFCLTSRILVQWLVYQCQKIPLLQNKLPIRLNSTLAKKNGKFTFFSRPDEGHMDMFTKEQFVKIKVSKLILAIEKILSRNTCNKQQLQLTLQNHFQLGEKELSDYIESLIKVGFLQRGFSIPDQAVSYCKLVAEALEHLQEPDLNLVAQHFYHLHTLELAFKKANVEQRSALLESFEKVFLTLSSLLGAQDPGLKQARNYIYEDIGQVFYDYSEVKADFSRYQKEFITLIKLLPLFDDSTIEKIAIYHFFRKLYPTRENVSLLEFYKTFASQPISILSDMMVGKEIAEVQLIKQLRLKWHQALHRAMKTSSNLDTLPLSNSWLEEFLKEIPNSVGQLNSVLLYLQKNEVEEVVLNGAAMGYGAMFSRFCSIFPEDTYPISKIIREELNKLSGDKMTLDLVAVLGINTNLHPPILKNVLEYPGCRANLEDKIYLLKDLYLSCDEFSQRLKLTDKHTHREMAFNPLNFLLPAAGPNLYRFLYLFSPYLLFKGGFWQRYFTHFPNEEKRVFPRLKIGNVVLNRKMWIIKTNTLPALKLLFTDPLKALLEIHSWRETQKLPLCGFFQPKWVTRDGIDWVTATQNHIKESNTAKFKKPYYFDFRNIFLLRMMYKKIIEEDFSEIIIQECLPKVDSYLTPPYIAAEEYLIQLNHYPNG